MSSTDKTKFNITETSKQANVDITSDKVQLPADTADHTLVAIVPSNANCTSGVNVEVEMSPDGENWCPALRKETVTTAGTTAPAIIGNEKYVDLQKNDPVFNSYAKGGLNFDVNGNEVSLGTGDRDLLDQHIAVNKSFNYSMWTKSDTLPTSTYKPVLFRHGGYDTFENTKAVALTAPLSENEAIPTLQSNTKYLAGNATSTNNNGDWLKGTYASLFYNLNSANSINTMPDFEDAWTVSGWIRMDGSFQTEAFWKQQGSVYSPIQLYTYDRSIYAFIRHAYNTTSYSITDAFNVDDPAGDGSVPAIPSDTWMHFVYTKQSTSYDSNTSTWTYGNNQSFVEGALNQFLNLTIRYIDSNGNIQTFSRGSRTTGATSISSYAHNNYGAILTVTGAYTWANRSSYRGAGQVDVDELVGIAGVVSSSESLGLFNNGKPIDPRDVITSASAREVKTWWRFGDGPNDVITPGSESVESVINPSTSLVLQGSVDGILNLTSSDQIYVNYTQITQNLCEPFSNKLKYINDTYRGALSSTTSPIIGNYNKDCTSDNIGFFPSLESSGNARSSDTISYSFWFKGDSTVPANGTYNVLWSERYMGAPSTYPDFFEAYYERYNNVDYLILKRKDYAQSGTQSGHYFTVVFNMGSGNTALSDDNWHHFTFTFNNSNMCTGSKLYVDGNSITAGSVNSASQVITKTPCRSIHIGGSRHRSASGISEIDYTHHINTSGSGLPSSGKFEIDQFLTWDKELSQTEARELCGLDSAGNGTLTGTDPFIHSAVSNLERVFDMEGSSDGISIYDQHTNTSFALASYDSQNNISTLTSTDEPSYGYPATRDYFTSSSNLSISGWFKTKDTGTLFSNTGGAAATGMKMEVNASDMTLSLLNASQSVGVSSDVNDGEWHHIVMTKPSGTSPTFKVYIDGAEVTSTQATNISDDDLKGDNGFTLIGDGQNNANAASPAATDSSKLQASLSNWSIHSEVLDQYAVKQLYSNGHVRNINNLPSVNTANIEAWWQLNDATNPQNDISGNNYHLQYLANITVANSYYMSVLRHGDTAIATTDTNWMLDTNQITSPFYDSSDSSPTQATPTFSDGMSGSLWVNIPWSGTQESNWRYKDIFRIHTSNGKAISLIHTWHNNLNTHQWRLKIGDANGTGNYLATFYNVNSYLSNTWHYVTWSVQGTGTSGAITPTTTHSTSDLKLWIDGNPISATSVSTALTVDDSYTSGTTIDNLTLGRRLNTSYFEPLESGNIYLDSLTFYKGYLDDAAATSIYSNRNTPEQATLPAGTKLTSFFKGGDGPNDTSTSVQSILSTNNTITFIPGTTVDSNPGTTASYTGTEAPVYSAPTGVLSNDLVNASGATLIEKSINGNALTLSITKNFDFVNEVWISDASGDAALCLSLNGFEEQAEYFALWKCSQTLPDGVVDVCDGNWHNIALSYRGQNDLAGDNVAEGDAVRFGRGSADNPFNFSLAIDGYPLYTEIGNNTGADYIGGNNALLTDVINSVTYNVGFNIYNRHLKYDPNNNNEQYRVHGQFGPAVHTYLVNETDPNSFRGEVDETSFHSDPWWSNADGTNIDVFGADTSKRGNLFNKEKTYTLYGRTTALAFRGTAARYPTGVPYPLLNPELLVTSGNITDIQGTNQFLNPVRKGDTQPWDSQPSAGGLEGWWRWGDTPGDCSITVNDVKDHESTPAVDYRDIQAVYLTDQGASSNVVLATNESIYLESQEASTTPGSAGTQYNQIKLEDLSTLIGTATCAVKDFVSPVLQYLRIKLTGTGTCDIGDGKLEIEVNHKKRRMK